MSTFVTDNPAAPSDVRVTTAGVSVMVSYKSTPDIRVRYCWGGFLNLNQSEARKPCFLAYLWLEIRTLPENTVLQSVTNVCPRTVINATICDPHVPLQALQGT